MSDKYKIIGLVYGALSRVYSGKAIQRAREAMLDQIRPGQKVLFAGAGYGLDAIRAAQKGANVTIVELSPTMLAKFRQNKEISSGMVNVRQVQADILRFDEFAAYDMVVANFFLNIFDQTMMRAVLSHLVKLGKPGANLVVGDFIFPTGNYVVRAFQNGYWFLANALFRILADNPIHHIYHYPSEMQTLGLSVRKTNTYKHLGVPMFWSVMATIHPATAG